MYIDKGKKNHEIPAVPKLVVLAKVDEDHLVRKRKQ